MNLSFPISLLLSLALLIIIAIGSYSSWNKMSAWRHPLTAAVLLLLFAIVNGIEGTWVLELQHSWAMYVIVVLLLLSLGLAICHKIQKTYSKALSLHTSKERLRLWLRKMPFLLLHTGAFLVLFGGFFGAPDKEDGQVLLEYGKPTHIAYQANGEMLPLPFDVQIDTFYIDYYADGRSPKQFTTRFTIRKIGETMDEGARMLSDEGARIKDERLNSAYSETSETKVTSPSSCVLHPSSFIQRGSLFEQALVLDPATSLPADILLRRPDVRAAEQNMARAFYAVNYARSSFFPSLTLSGSLGWTNHSYATIINPMTFISSLAASLFVPLFQSGRNIQQLKMAKSQQREALLMFSQTVLSAGNEVNNALHNYQTLADKQSLYDSQVEALQRAAKATKLKMQYGSTTYLEVLTAQNSLLQAQFTQIANRMQTLQAVVTLYRALGGGSAYK